MENIIIYDTEIKHGVITPNNQPRPGYRYADGWKDFAGMGVSVIGAYDIDAIGYRVFCDDNLHEWRDLAERAKGIVSFNGNRFDGPLLAANGCGFPVEKSIDLAAIIWRAAGIPEGEHPKGLGLDAICRANGIPGKTGNAADAPQDWQAGKIGTVIDYCLADVRITKELYFHIQLFGCITDPRTGEKLDVRLPDGL